MNIFWLSSDLEECAKMHVDKHVVKMITEYAQLLNTVYYYTGEFDKVKYLLSHHNHPCAIWCRESLDNWEVLRLLGLNLYDEYKYRYGDYKIHKAGEVIKSLRKPNIESISVTEPPQCMPEDVKDYSSFIQGYRNYYNKYKRNILCWTGRDIPDWIDR